MENVLKKVCSHEHWLQHLTRLYQDLVSVLVKFSTTNQGISQDSLQPCENEVHPMIY